MSNVILDLFDLRQDQAESDAIDEIIRNNVKVVGTNLWVLIFAILVASVGLNVNSTAVIIGAMLISPLMGPIVGIGYGLGINDIQLIKLAVRNLLIFTFISVIASTLYFTISPLNTAQPELLSRTSPTLWDVLIAFFGGAAGIIATTRKSMSNVIPGVAIATALMPPLCTAGFGIAQGNWSYFGGAFFLYTINSVFIALATWMFVKIFHLPVRHYLDEKVEQRTNLIILIIVMAMIIPSAFLALNLVNQTRFTQVANQYVNTSFRNNDYVLLAHEVNALKQEIILTIGGSHNPQRLKANLEKELNSAGFDKANVVVRYSGTSEIDLGSLKTQLTQDLYNNLLKQLDEVNNKNLELSAKVSRSAELVDNDHALFDELIAQYPLVMTLTVSRGERFKISDLPALIDKGSDSAKTETNQSETDKVESDKNEAKGSVNTEDSENKKMISPEKIQTNESVIHVTVASLDSLEESDKKRILDWFEVKFKDEVLELRFEVANLSE